MTRPIRLFGNWWLVKDTGAPVSYPPKACDELVHLRLANDDLRTEQLVARWQHGR